MGYPSLHENIRERHADDAGSAAHALSLVYKNKRLTYAELQDLLQHFTEKQDRERPLIEQWGRFRVALESLETALSSIIFPEKGSVNPFLSEETIEAVKTELQRVFVAYPEFGTLSKQIFDDIQSTFKYLLGLSTSILMQFMTTPSESREVLNKYYDLINQTSEFRGHLSSIIDLKDRASLLWPQCAEFIKQYAAFCVRTQHRPNFQDVGLHLVKGQEQFISVSYDSCFRIRGASGSGKTVILLHRAIRLARNCPMEHVYIFTINEALKDRLTSQIKMLIGPLPRNLHVESMYSYLFNCFRSIGQGNNVRLWDPQSGERSRTTWQEYLGNLDNRHDPPAKAKDKLISYLNNQNTRPDPVSYLYHEMIFIQSLLPNRYLEERRTSRCIPFREEHRKAALDLLTGWLEWQNDGAIWDVNSLPFKAKQDFLDKPTLSKYIRSQHPIDYVLVDEVQDFSTLELHILRSLIRDVNGKNRFFFVGDLTQKVFTKHQSASQSGFQFPGRSRLLKQNYRNTKQILRAALNLPTNFPPAADDPEDSQPLRPDLSQHEGDVPKVIPCDEGHEVDTIVSIIQRELDQEGREPANISIVSPANSILEDTESRCKKAGIKIQRLFVNEDLDLRRKTASGDPKGVVLGNLETIKGFEFETVIVAGLSQGAFPAPGIPRDEYWHPAAILYVAMTRAQQKLILTYSGKPSPFLDVMRSDLAYVELPHYFK